MVRKSYSSENVFLTRFLLKMLEKRNVILKSIKKNPFILSILNKGCLKFCMLNFTVIITCQLQKGAEITHCNKNFCALANRTHLGFVKGDSIDYCFLSTLIILNKIHFPFCNFCKFSLQCSVDFMNFIINLFRWCFSSSSISCVC